MVVEICDARLPHAPQVLHSDSEEGMGETSGMEARDDDERSKRVAMTTPAQNSRDARIALLHVVRHGVIEQSFEIVGMHTGQFVVNPLPARTFLALLLLWHFMFVMPLMRTISESVATLSDSQFI